MAVLRINKKEKNFLILDKTCLNEAELSWGAKGLHSYLMGLPQDWQVKVKDLTSRATNGRDSVKGLLSELKDAGYISQEWIRDEVTKQYKSLEYIVHELPQKNHSSEPLEPEKRETDYQSPVNPVTEKAPLISINSTNNTNNKVIKAAAMTVESRDEKTKENPAAAFFVEFNSFFHKAEPKPQTAVLHSLPSSDALIGESLSPKQIERTRALVGRLKASGLISNPTALKDEISFCLLSPKHFKACKQDFGHKLNAIRTVILRGDWQTPSEMLIESKEEANVELNFLEKELQAAYAESAHFERLLKDSSPAIADSFKKIIAKAEVKILSLEKEIEHLSEETPEREGRLLVSL